MNNSNGLTGFGMNPSSYGAIAGAIEPFRVGYVGCSTGEPNTLTTM